ncbi:hypothetical protein TXYLGN1_12060 [Tepidimicrobium xylanilyticum]|nr:hypothetical protein EN5CB1_25690 [Tepidimicrobium xylanilyticum]
MKYIVFIIPILLVLLLIYPVKFTIDFRYGMDYSYLEVTTSYLFGLIKPEIYPFDKENRSRKYNTGFIDRTRSLFRDDKYKQFVNTILKKIVVEHIHWETRIGLKDAFLVGMITGFIWIIKSFIVGLLLNEKDVKKLSFNVIPCFLENQLEIEFNCIIKIRMVYIITVWIWILKSNKGGEKVDRTSNRRVNENYYE